MKVLTTGQAARVCRLGSKTMTALFDSGRVQGYRIPGTQDRRYPRAYLLKFMREHGLLAAGLGQELFPWMVVLSARPQLRETIRGICERAEADANIDFAEAPSAFAAGMTIAAKSVRDFRLPNDDVVSNIVVPDAVILDCSIGLPQAVRIAQSLTGNAQFDPTFVAAIGSAAETDELAGLVDACCTPEADMKPLLEAIFMATRAHKPLVEAFA